MMRYLRCDENLIRKHGVNVLTMFYALRARNTNGVLYRDRVVTSKKMGVDRSTLSRWISTLIDRKLAHRDTNGQVRLVSLEDAIRGANEGRLPHHRCTLRIGELDTRQELKRAVLLKLLEEFHRQVQHKRQETKIKQITQERYGNISNKRIQEQVKSRVWVGKEVGVPMSGKAIAKRIGVSVREWHNLLRLWVAEGAIESFKDEESLGFMSFDQYTAARGHFGFASKRTRKGEVFKINPNRIQLGMDYRKPTITIPESPQELTLDQCYFRFLESGTGKRFPVLVLPEGALLKRDCIPCT